MFINTSHCNSLVYTLFFGWLSTLLQTWWDSQQLLLVWSNPVNVFLSQGDIYQRSVTNKQWHLTIFRGNSNYKYCCPNSKKEVFQMSITIRAFIVSRDTGTCVIIVCYCGSCRMSSLCTAVGIKSRSGISFSDIWLHLPPNVLGPEITDVEHTNKRLTVAECSLCCDPKK